MKYDDPLIDEDKHGNANVSSEKPLKPAGKLIFSLILVVVTGYALLSLFIFQIVRFIPFEKEQKWFSSLSNAVLEQFTEPNDSEYHNKTAELQRIADKIVQATLDKNPNHPLSDITITMHYSDDSIINAFAMPGGHIVVMKGLIKALPNENVLAMVIAHEIAHVIHRDSLKKMGRSLLTNVILYALIGGNNPNLVNQGITLLSTKYSRSDETHADNTGIILLHNAYHNAYGATQLFNAFAKVSPKQSRWVNISKTHPLPLDRKKNMEEKIQQHGYRVDHSSIAPLKQTLTQ